MTKELGQRFEALTIDKGQYLTEHGFHIGDKVKIEQIQDLEDGWMWGGDYGTVLSIESRVEGDDLFGDNVHVNIVVDVVYKICGVKKHCTMSFINDLDIRPNGHRPTNPEWLRNIYTCTSPMECFWYKSDGDGEELYSISRVKKT